MDYYQSDLARLIPGIVETSQQVVSADFAGWLLSQRAFRVRELTESVGGDPLGIIRSQQSIDAIDAVLSGQVNFIGAVNPGDPVGNVGYFPAPSAPPPSATATASRPGFLVPALAIGLAFLLGRKR